MTRVRSIPCIVAAFLTKHCAGSWSPPSAPLSSSAPDESSHLPPESAYFLAANRNKRSLTVNFKDPSGLEVMRRLVQRADVMVENYIPGKLCVPFRTVERFLTNAVPRWVWAGKNAAS
jgi:hypothetical protein